MKGLGGVFRVLLSGSFLHNKKKENHAALVHGIKIAWQFYRNSGLHLVTCPCLSENQVIQKVPHEAPPLLRYKFHPGTDPR